MPRHRFYSPGPSGVNDFAFSTQKLTQFHFARWARQGDDRQRDVVVRYNDRQQATDDKIRELHERFGKISINDSNLWPTQAVPHARQLKNMPELARVITLGALHTTNRTSPTATTTTF